MHFLSKFFFLFELKSSLLLKINSSLIAENAPNFKNYEVLGLNADHTYFCGSIQLIEEIINHKAQPQGNSPLSAGFYYHLDCLKECLFVLILASVILFISFSTPVRLERVGAEVPPTMQPHFLFVVPEPSYLKFGTVAVLTVMSAKIH